MTYVIGVSDYIDDGFGQEIRTLGPGFKVVRADLENPDAAGRLDGLLVWHRRISPHVIDMMKNCKIICRYGVGIENVDYEYAASKGIVFCNTPDYGTMEVADTSVAMGLWLLRRIGLYDARARGQLSGWQSLVDWPLSSVQESVVGLVGYGRIGREVAKRYISLGAQVLVFDPHVTWPRGVHPRITRTSDIKKLAAKSDLVSFHCSLNKETRGMISRNFLSSMKVGASIVNTSRGQVLESTQVLQEFLEEGKIFGAGLDVLPDEPPNKKDSLIRDWMEGKQELAGRLIVNPHTAYYSKQAYARMRKQAATTVAKFLLTKSLDGLPVVKRPNSGFEERELDTSADLFGR